MQIKLEGSKILLKLPAISFRSVRYHNTSKENNCFGELYEFHVREPPNIGFKVWEEDEL